MSGQMILQDWSDSYDSVSGLDHKQAHTVNPDVLLRQNNRLTYIHPSEK